MDEIVKMTDKIQEVGGQPMFVGGFVRDKVLGFQSKDIDIEVFGLKAQTLIEILSTFGKVDTVGASFGVIKLTTETNDFDFSLPRRDNKIGRGHKGFIVEVDHTMTVSEAASRRDFTWNALAMDCRGNIHDHFNGLKDAQSGIIRHTSPAFAEDPLRVLRGMQFAGRFDMKVAQETTVLCRSLKSEFHTLAVERVWGEFWKWATKSTVPSKGMDFLVDTGWVELFPEMKKMIDCPQDPEWHPEGDVWEHTRQVVDQAVVIAQRDNLSSEDKGCLVLAALCHDMGKPETTVKDRDGRWSSPGHNNPKTAGDFMDRIGCPKAIKARVMEIVKEHMSHLSEVTKRTVRRLMSRISAASIDDIVRVIEADHSGRHPLPKSCPDSAIEIQRIAESMGNEISPIIQGRHLIEIGMKPGKQFGHIIKEAFEAQIEGVFDDVSGGKNFVARKHG